MENQFFCLSVYLFNLGKRSRKYLRPFMEENEDFDPYNYIDALYAGKSLDDEVYGIPYGVNQITLAYNKTAFDDWTHQDMIDAVEKFMRDNNGDRKSLYLK